MATLLLAGLGWPAASAVDPEYTMAPNAILPLAPSANATTMPLGDDEVSGAIGLGFATRLFGQSTNLFWIGSNGFITLFFQTPPGCCDGQAFPTPGGPDGIIAPFWTDLTRDAASSIRFQNLVVEGQPALLVDYRDMVVEDGVPGHRASFQVVLLQNGVFETFVSDATIGPARTFTIGAESLDGQRGIQLTSGSDTTLTGVGARFEPVPTAAGTPHILTTGPIEMLSGNGLFISTSGVEPGALVALDRNASRFVVFPFTTNPDFVGFTVPFVPAGPYRLRIVNPSGLESPENVTLIVREPLRVFGLTQDEVGQAQEFGVFGSGFRNDTRVFLDGALIPSRSVSSSFMLAQVPARFPAGLYELSVFHTGESEFRFFFPIVVLPRADLAIEDLRLEPEAIHVAGALDVPMPGWRVTGTVRNLGDATSGSYVVDVSARPEPGLGATGEDFWGSLDGAPLAAGAARAFELRTDARGVGDWTARASLSTGDDRDPTNGEANASSFWGVGGLGGARPQLGVPALPPTPPLPEAPAPENATVVYEERSHRVETLDQTDLHGGVALRVDTVQDVSEITFIGFDSVFSSSHARGDAVVECTTWRFLGSGRLSVDTQPADAATAQIANGTHAVAASLHQETRWNDTRVAGTVLTESARTTTSLAPAAPALALSTSPGRAWRLVGDAPTGDFSECRVFAPDGGFHMEVTFAALPVDVGLLVPNFAGVGHVGTLTVDRDEATHEVVVLRRIL